MDGLSLGTDVLGCCGFHFWSGLVDHLEGKALGKTGWAIAASLMYVLIFLRQFIIPLRPALDHDAGNLFVGIVGLVTFLWPSKYGAA